MTVEEALLVLLAAVAGILLFLGLAQALDNRPPHPMRRRRRPPEDSPGSGPGEAPSGNAAPPPAIDSPARRPFIGSSVNAPAATEGPSSPPRTP